MYLQRQLGKQMPVLELHDVVIVRNGFDSAKLATGRIVDLSPDQRHVMVRYGRYWRQHGVRFQLQPIGYVADLPAPGTAVMGTMLNPFFTPDEVKSCGLLSAILRRLWQRKANPSTALVDAHKAAGRLG